MYSWKGKLDIWDNMDKLIHPNVLSILPICKEFKRNRVLCEAVSDNVSWRAKHVDTQNDIYPRFAEVVSWKIPHKTL